MMGTPRILTIASVWLAAGGVGVTLATLFGGTIEAALLPVLADQRIGNVTRADGQVCWSWHWRKTRPAMPSGFGWSYRIRGGQEVLSVRSPAVVVSQASREPILPVAEHAPGAGRTDMCARIPEGLRLAKGVVIEGGGRYAVGHPFWTLWQDFPVVEVPDDPR